MKYQHNLANPGLRILLLVIVFSLPFMGNAQTYMRANLKTFAADGSVILLDGNLTDYDNIYSNEVDINDAIKISNFGENLGILRNGQTLVVERRRTIETRDTTFFRMWNMQPRTYKLQIITSNLDQPGLMAILKDNYLNSYTEIGLNTTTELQFIVDGTPDSYNSMRFALIYSKPNTPSVPISFRDFKAYHKNNAVQVDWKVINELSVEKYNVEHSFDGRNFTDVYSVAASNTGVNSYGFSDISPISNDNFYRIRASRLTGSIEYSEIYKVSGFSESVGIYPNPATGKSFRLQLSDAQPGIYKLALIGMKGIIYRLNEISILSGQGSQMVTLPNNIPAGIYRLKIITPDNQQEILTVYLL